MEELLDAAALLEATKDCYSVRVLEVRAERQAARHRGDLGNGGAESLLEVEEGDVALRRGVRGDDHLADRAPRRLGRRNALKELAHAQLTRTNPRHRREGSI